jgi:quinohemoprotein ethanol dehydrogenase
VRSRLTALDAKTGKILWRWHTLPGPGEVGSDTWPAGTDHAMRGGASIWNTPALDPQLGLIYFATGNCGPDYDGRCAKATTCSVPRLSRLTPKPAICLAFPGGAQRHLGLRCGEPSRAVRSGHQRPTPQGACRSRPHRLGVHPRPHNGKPLIGIEERPVPQEPRQKTAKTQP